MWGHTADVIARVKFQVDGSKGLGSTATQNRVFPIDFHRRPYKCYALPCYTVIKQLDDFNTGVTDRRTDKWIKKLPYKMSAELYAEYEICESNN